MFESTAICGTIYIGKRGENKARRIRFDEPAQWKDIFGVGSYELINQRNGDNAPYPVVLSMEDGAVYWIVSSSDTAIEGEGKCELRYIVNDTVVKSQTWKTVVAEGLGEASSEVPEPQKEWVDRVLDAKYEAKASAESANQSENEAQTFAEKAEQSATDADACMQGAEQARDEALTYSKSAKSSEEKAKGYAESINPNKFSNTLKGNAEATSVLRMDDVSPIEHDMSVSVKFPNDYDKFDNLIVAQYELFEEYNKNGISITAEDDGTISVSGKSTESVSFYIYLNQVSISTGYYSGYLSVEYNEKSETVITAFQLGTNHALSGIHYFSTDFESSTRIRFSFVKGSYYDLKIKPMLCKGIKFFDSISNPKLSVYGGNLLSLEALSYSDGRCTPTAYTLNNLKVHIYAGKQYGECTTTKYNELLQRLEGHILTLSAKYIPPEYKISIVIKYDRVGGTNGKNYVTRTSKEGNNNKVSFVLDHSGRKITEIVIRPIYSATALSEDYETTVENLQLTIDNVDAPFAPYSEPIEYPLESTANEQSVCVKSICPVTLISDTDGVVIEVEYNKDLNKAFNEVINRLASIEEAII